MIHPTRSLPSPLSRSGPSVATYPRSVTTGRARPMPENTDAARKRLFDYLQEDVARENPDDCVRRLVQDQAENDAWLRNPT